jgi:ADP-ribose pyrophosphatase YjhB (NUDIX family)
MKKTVTAGGVVLNTKGEVLVVSQQASSWSLPKGHVQADEDLLTAAKREIEEESGISDLQLIRALGSYERPKIGDSVDNPSEIKQIHIFLFTTNQMELQPHDPENPEARWVDVQEVEKLLTAQKDKEFFRGVRDKL